MIHYIIQVILFQILFLAVYDLFLQKETFFNKNRWYLLGTSMVSFVLPLIKITTLQKVLPNEMTFSFSEFVDMSLTQSPTVKTFWIERLSTFEIVFLLGVILFLGLFLIKLVRILLMIHANEKIIKIKFTLVLLLKQTKAFSFFNYIFLGKDIPIEKQEKIIQHELVHSSQKHTLDLLFFELLRIIMWFNPMIYIYQKRITLVHEYISDAKVLQSTNKEHYINNLLSDVFQVENISFINQFYKHSFIKKRIIMMTKTKSNQIKQLKYLLLIPVLASMLLYTSCEKNYLEDNQLQDKTGAKQQKEKIEVEREVSFMIIDKAPVFPGCEGKKSGLKKCFSKGIAKHFANNFDANLPNKLGLSSGKKRVSIFFIIDKRGNIINIKCRAPHPDIKREVIKIMKSLPKMTPGEHQGRKVGVKYSIPLTIQVGTSEEELILEEPFNLQKISKTGKIVETIYEENVTDMSFMIVEKVPVFPGCKGTKKELKKCFSKGIEKHFTSNFNMNLPNQLGLSSGKKRVSIFFIIDKRGNVINIKCRAPHPDIKKEVMRIMESLPQMIPGEQRGKKIGVKYSIPFIIDVE